MSRSEARLAVTSSGPRKMRPPVGSSSPAIIRKVVVLPQPEGPSRQKNSPFPTVKSAPRTAAKLPKDFWRFSTGFLGHDRYRGNFETTMNITVPSSTVANE